MTTADVVSLIVRRMCRNNGFWTLVLLFLSALFAGGAFMFLDFLLILSTKPSHEGDLLLVKLFLIVLLPYTALFVFVASSLFLIAGVRSLLVDVDFFWITGSADENEDNRSIM
jgi:hypothetical protein